MLELIVMSCAVVVEGLGGGLFGCRVHRSAVLRTECIITLTYAKCLRMRLSIAYIEFRKLCGFPFVCKSLFDGARCRNRFLAALQRSSHANEAKPSGDFEIQSTL